ncbi:MAG: hypothetical protein HQL33_01705 [Alphaproteobacteria bacterium]|nr:hypothetical protein [Alphaproteobacteria bacterium]
MKSGVSTVAAFLAALVSTFAFWWVLGRPVSLPDVSSPKLSCASFAPYLPDQSPLNPSDVIPPEAIDSDLALLSPRFGCVRTYAVDQGLHEVPRLAHARGMKMLLGAWISGNPPLDTMQTDRALALAKAYPDTVRAIVVGNETLLRGELPASRLGEILRDVRRRSPVPVTYADVWEFWLRNPELARDVDFITIHILPFWEDEPMSVDDALAHVERILAKVERAFPDKKILIGEVGWPSAGRMRGPAEPGRVNQARFIRQFVTLAEARKVDYNLIEALDQPWKRVLEGTVGGYWGLYDVDRNPKFPLTGPLSEHPHWLLQFAASAALGIVLLLGAGRPIGWRSCFAALAAGTIVLLQAEQIGTMAVSAVHWLAGGATLVLSTTTAWLLLASPGSSPAPLHHGFAWARGGFAGARGGFAGGDARAVALGGLRGLALFGATMATLGLAFDPRYRDFPVAVFLIPALGFLRFPPSSREAGEMVEEAWLGAVLALAAAAVLVQEGMDNHQALAWVGVALALAWPGVRAGWLRVRSP